MMIFRRHTCRLCDYYYLYYYHLIEFCYAGRARLLHRPDLFRAFISALMRFRGQRFRDATMMPRPWWYSMNTPYLFLPCRDIKCYFIVTATLICDYFARRHYATIWCRVTSYISIMAMSCLIFTAARRPWSIQYQPRILFRLCNIHICLYFYGVYFESDVTGRTQPHLRQGYRRSPALPRCRASHDSDETISLEWENAPLLSTLKASCWCHKILLSRLIPDDVRSCAISFWHATFRWARAQGHVKNYAASLGWWQRSLLAFSGFLEDTSFFRRQVLFIID